MKIGIGYECCGLGGGDVVYLLLYCVCGGIVV